MVTEMNLLMAVAIMAFSALGILGIAGLIAIFLKE